MELPNEQLEWILSFKLLFKLSQNYNKVHLDYLIEDIEREASEKGYLEVMKLLKSYNN
ncbi:MAG: hypothetical protein ABFR32_12115 [Bacteroidota bacterium]